MDLNGGTVQLNVPPGIVIVFIYILMKMENIEHTGGQSRSGSNEKFLYSSYWYTNMYSQWAQLPLSMKTTTNFTVLQSPFRPAVVGFDL